MNKCWKFNVDILILSKVLGSEMKCFGFGIQKMIQKITKDCKRFQNIDSDRFIFNQQAAQNANFFSSSFSSLTINELEVHK